MLCYQGFPAPLLYGAVIDSTCLVLQTSCARKGACLLYDQEPFRLRLHSLPVLAKIGAFMMYCLATYASIRRDRKEKDVNIIAIVNNNNAINLKDQDPANKTEDGDIEKETGVVTFVVKK